MATWYVDPSGSAGDGTGTSFANRASAVYGAANNASTIHTNVAAGDEIRIKKSPDATSLGTCKVNNKNPDTSYYCSNISLNTWSTTAGETTFNHSGHLLETGDFIFINNESSLTTNRINGLWKVTVVNSNTFKLDGYIGLSSGSISNAKYKIMTSNVLELNTSNITKTIVGGNDKDYSGNAVPSWTASTGVTYTQINNNSASAWSAGDGLLYGPVGHKFVVDTNQSSGTKLAYFQLDSATDFSDYQQISLMFAQTAGTVNQGGNVKLCLCSDTTGDTIVDQTDAFDNSYNNGNSHTGYVPITYDKGSALGSTINSVALYAANTNYGGTYQFETAIACKASSANDCLTYNSVVSLNTTADPYWLPIGLVYGNYILNEVADPYQKRWYAQYYTGGGYFRSASNASATLYVRQCLKVLNRKNNWSQAGIDSAPIYLTGKNGTSGNEITISGGWDDTAMSTKNGETFIDGELCRINSGLRLNSSDFINTERIHPVRFRTGNKFQYSDNISIDTSYPTQNWYEQSYLFGCVDVKKFKQISAGAIRGRHLECSTSKKHSSSNITDFIYKCNLNTQQISMMNIYGAGGDLHFDEVDVRGTAASGFNCYNLDSMLINKFYGGNTGISYSGTTGFDISLVNTPGPNKFVVNTLYAMGRSQGYCIKDQTCGAVIKKLEHTNFLNGDGSFNKIKSCMQTQPSYAVLCGSKTPTVIGETGGSFANGGVTFQDSGNARTHDLEFTHSGTMYGTGSMGQAEVSDYDGVSGDVRTLFKLHSVIKETSITQAGSGTAWKQEFNQVTTTANKFTIGKIAVNGGSQVTLSVYIRRGDVNVYGGIHIYANGLIGVSDVSVLNNTSTVDQWAQISANCTPTAAGVIEVALGGYKSAASSSNIVYYDTFSATQA